MTCEFAPRARSLASNSARISSSDFVRPGNRERVAAYIAQISPCLRNTLRSDCTAASAFADDLSLSPADRLRVVCGTIQFECLIETDEAMYSTVEFAGSHFCSASIAS